MGVITALLKVPNTRGLKSRNAATRDRALQNSAYKILFLLPTSPGILAETVPLASRRNKVLTIPADSEPVHASIRGWTGVTKTAVLKYEDEKIELSQIKNSTDIDLSDVRELDLYVHTGNNPGSICDNQDALFAFLSRLGRNHVLARLGVHLSIEMPHDRYGLATLFTSSYSGPLLNLKTAHEFRAIRVGDISRAHFAAFLSDPLRIIRNIENGKKQDKFSLKYPGETSTPWMEIGRRVRDMVKGAYDSEERTLDYQTFSRYFSAAKPLAKALSQLADLVGEEQAGFSASAYAQLCHARIVGDFETLRKAHDALLEAVRDIIVIGEQTYDPGVRRPDQFQKERLMRELVYLAENLNAASPEETNVTFYGYNEADARLDEYRHNKKDFVTYESKPKRKVDEEEGGRRKKAKR